MSEKKYRVKCWALAEFFDDDDIMTKKEAEDELQQAECLYPENIYKIVEVE